MALAIRRISVQPINSLMTGGLGWFSNLASPDPFYILPLITSLSIPMILYVSLTSGCVHAAESYSNIVEAVMQAHTPL